jgi:hypothetical protein
VSPTGGSCRPGRGDTPPWSGGHLLRIPAPELRSGAVHHLPRHDRTQLLLGRRAGRRPRRMPSSAWRRINAEAVLALNRAGVNLNNLVPLVAADVNDVLEQLRAQLRACCDRHRQMRQRVRRFDPLPAPGQEG